MPKRLLLAGALGTLGAGGGMSFAASENPHAPAPVEQELFILPVDQLTVPIVDAGRLDGSLKLKIAIEMKDAAARDALGQRMPEVRAASVQAVSDFTRLYAASFSAVNAEMLREQMKQALIRTDPAVKDVLILQVSAEAA